MPEAIYPGSMPVEPLDFQAVRALPLGPGQLAVWWLAQASFLLKLHTGAVLLIDPWLTGGPIGSGTRGERLTPPPIQPEQLDVDAVFISHDHLDHLDSETLRRMPAALACPVLGPRRVIRALNRDGLLPACPRVQLDAGDTHTLPGDVHVRATFCIPNDERAIDTVGFHIQSPGGPAFLLLGDTAYADFLYYLARYPAEILALPVNEGYGNLSHPDAANLVRLLRPQTVIPYHYGCFPRNDGDPLLFRKRLIAASIEPPVEVLTVGRAYVHTSARM